MMKGIDVSEYQGIIDWKKVKAAGCRFAVLRAVRRDGSADMQFEANVRGCLENDIPFDVYRYTYALLPTEAQKEADQVIRLLQAYGIRTCRIWWDVEDRSLETRGKEVLTGLIRTAENTAAGAGYAFGIYTGLFFYREGYFDGESLDCPLWIADYPISRSFPFSEEPPADGHGPVIGQPLFAWQYSGKGIIEGILAPVDLDVCYMPFR